MFERDYGAEIDVLRSDINEIKELLKGTQAGKHNAKEVNDENRFFEQKIEGMSDDVVLHALRERLQNESDASGSTGKIAYTGFFKSGEGRASWTGEYNTDHLLKLIEDRTAEKVLGCIGSGDKLNILLALLKKPMTVAQIVTEGGFNSTGQVYHHLNALIAADLVEEDIYNNNKGTYIVVPYHVQGIIMLLAGICDMLNGEKYDRPGFEQSWY